MRITDGIAVLMIAVLSSATVQSGGISRDALEKALQEHPDVLIKAVAANKKAIFEIMSQAATEEQARAKQEAEAAETKAFEDSFLHPLEPLIDNSVRIRGRSDARFTLVEYADFQCPYCAAGYQTVETLRKEHPGDLRFVFKHLPLPFHPQSMPAAQWLEAVALQSTEKAWRFHDILFENQDKLGIDFFKKTAGELGLDVQRCEHDAASQIVKDRIAADEAEASKLGFSGTPGFLLNGIPVKGAYPASHFGDIIDRLAGSKGN